MIQAIRATCVLIVIGSPRTKDIMAKLGLRLLALRYTTKMHDGMIRTLKYAKHIPNFKKNLVSLSTLDAKGCRFMDEGGVIKIMGGSLLLMKGLKLGTLYQLQGTIVIGSIAVSSAMIKSDNTKL